jgi:hypothetical protein
VTESPRNALPFDDAMKTTLFPLLLVFGCALQDRSIGDEIENMDPASDDDGASGNMSPTESSSGGEPVGMRVGAVLGSDGLCPFQFSKAHALTLQFTPGSEVCKAALREPLIEAGDAPTWYVWIGVPLAEAGVYDFAGDEDDDVAEVIDANEGGGGAGGGHSIGSLEIFRIDSTGVYGEFTNVDFGVGGVFIDLSGPFTASWCSEAEWLDIDFDPANEPPEGYDPACKIPGG